MKKILPISLFFISTLGYANTPFQISSLYESNYNAHHKKFDWSHPASEHAPSVITSALTLFDSSRSRSIPIQMYVSNDAENKAKCKKTRLPIVIINHGYTVKHTEYSFLAHDLAIKGYFVISIQHDLKTDVPLPKSGDLFKNRKPCWQNGVQNILFTLSELKKIKPYLNVDKIILIGHSNGGDIAMLFTTQYPKKVSTVISLDSLRHPFPTQNHIPILSLRALDTQADKHVLPDLREYIKITSIQAKHIEMYDAGPIEVKEQILTHISKFLKKPL